MYQLIHTKEEKKLGWMEMGIMVKIHVPIHPQEIDQKTYPVENVHLKIIYNFYNKTLCHKQTQSFKMAFY
jgi:hypothetical protein